MTKKLLLIFGFMVLLLTGCLSLGDAPGAPYSPYYLVTVPADATATATPFQPSQANAQQQPVLPTLAPLTSSPTPLPPVPSATLLPTPTDQPTQQPTPQIASSPQPVIDAPESVTFLLLGSDTPSGSSFRTDTILIVSVRPRDGQVSLISIPRDLWVNIPTVGMQRINTAYEFGASDYPGGGAGLLKDTILYNLGLQIDHTAMVDFDGFKKIVDTLGGIDVPVTCPYTDWHLVSPDLDPQNPNNWSLYTVGPGLIHMDGDLALWYARSRQESNDFDRGRRQQEVIRALFQQALRSDSLSHIPQLYDDFNGLVTTDLGLPDILKLAPFSLHLNNADIRSYYIAGDMVTPWTTPGGAYVLLPNTQLIQNMLSEALSPSQRQQQRTAIKVEIQNGSANDNWDALAAQRLNYAGYETSLHPADNRNHVHTLLYDLTPDQDPNRSTTLLAVLGLPQSALVSVPTQNNQSSYVLIVGNDYQACFDPHGMAP